MSCFKSKQVALREMSFVLNYFESEIQELEDQKNELRVKYHGRPLDERNIMKDILTMHNEFEKDITKLKTITEGFSKVPPVKSKTTDTVEKRFKDVAKMQESIIKFQETIQNLLICKVHYQTQNEDLKNQVNDLEDQTNFLKRELYKLQEYDNDDDFIERHNFLIEEYKKLTHIIDFLEDEHPKITSELSLIEISELNDTKVANELKRVIIENAMLKDAIDSCSDTVNRDYDDKDLIDMVEVKRCEVGLLKEKYTRLQEEINFMKVFDDEEEEVENEDYTKNIRLLDIIIGKKNDKSESMSPRVSFQKKPSLLDDVMASLNKARAIASPVKGK
jgi:chromosome segregation ATPase